MRVTAARIHALGLDWPGDLVDDDGTIDLDAVLAQLARDERAAESRYIASLVGGKKPGSDAARDRYFELRDLGHHAAGVLALVCASGDRSLGAGPVPRSTIAKLGLPCGELLRSRLTDADGELDLIQTMLGLVRDYRWVDAEYDGLDAQRSRYGAEWDDITDRHDELVEKRSAYRTAIQELSAILAAVCT